MPLAWPSLFDFIAKRQQANPYNEAITGPLQFPTPRSVQPCRALTEEIMSVNGDKQIIYRNYTKVPRMFTVCEGVLTTVGPASANARRETRRTRPSRAPTEESMSVNGDKQIIYRNYTKVPRMFTVCEGVLAIVGPASANTRRETLRTWPSRALTAQEFMFANGDRQIIYRNYTKVPRKFTVCEGVVTIGPALASTRRETRRTRSSKRSCAQSSPPSTKRKRG
jgi:hypothetical protein